jgi:hypothetical protein
MSDDEAAEGGGDHGGGLGGKLRGQGAAERLGVRRVGEHEGALKVFGAVETAGEAEMSFQVGAGLFKER